MNTNYLNERNNEYVTLLDEVGVYYNNSFREIVDEINIPTYLAFTYQYKRKLFEIFISEEDCFVRLEEDYYFENTEELLQIIHKIKERN